MKRLQELVRSHSSERIWLPQWAEILASLGISATDPLIARRQRLANIFACASAFNFAFFKRFLALT